MRRFTSLFSAFLLLLLAVGLSRGDASEPVPLEIRVAEGDEFFFRYGRQVEIEETGKGESYETHFLELRFRVDETGPEGTDITCRIDRVTVDLDLYGQGRFHFDSEELEGLPRRTDAFGPFIRPYVELAGKEIPFRLRADGEIQLLESENPTPAPTMENPFVRDAETIPSSRWKAVFSQVFGAAPGRSVTEGSAWEKKERVSLGDQALECVTTFTVRKVEVLGDDPRVVCDMLREGDEAGVVQSRKGRGECQFDTATGLPLWMRLEREIVIRWADKRSTGQKLRLVTSWKQVK